MRKRLIVPLSKIPAFIAAQEQFEKIQSEKPKSGSLAQWRKRLNAAKADILKIKPDYFYSSDRRR